MTRKKDGHLSITTALLIIGLFPLHNLQFELNMSQPVSGYLYCRGGPLVAEQGMKFFLARGK